MTDLLTLSDAFAELERRADAYCPAPESAAIATGRPRRLLVPAAAAAVTTLLIVAGAVTLWQHPWSHSAGAPAGGRLSAAAPTPTASIPTPAGTTPAPIPRDFVAPTEPRQVAAEFTRILAGSATFTVTDHGQGSNGTTLSGMAIVGQLTADGVTGGYIVGIYPADPHQQALCDLGASCVHSQLPDGSDMTVETDSISATRRSYTVDVVRPEGAEINISVATTDDTNLSGTVTAERPPLSTDQLVAIATSDDWLAS